MNSSQASRPSSLRAATRALRGLHRVANDEHDVANLEAGPVGAEEPGLEPAGMSDPVVVDEDLSHESAIPAPGGCSTEVGSAPDIGLPNPIGYAAIGVPDTTPSGRSRAGGILVGVECAKRSEVVPGFTAGIDGTPGICACQTPTSVRATMPPRQSR